MTVVGEGVETVTQLEIAWESGIRIIQGFLFSKALTAAEAHRLIIGKAARASALAQTSTAGQIQAGQTSQPDA